MVGDQIGKWGKRRLNKKKFAVALGVLAFLAVIVVALVLLTEDILAKTAEPAVAQDPESTKSPKRTQSDAVQTPSDTEEGGTGINAGRSVVVDAGHGGFDPGAEGASGVREDELNLKVAQYLEKELKKTGAKVVMTRTTGDALYNTKDSDFEKRRQVISESGSDIVVSVHMNSHSDISSAGPIVLFMQGSGEGEKLANALQEALNGSLDPASPYKARADNLFILRCGMQPCVILECGFLSNGGEEEKLKTAEYQLKIAKAACEGITAYLNAAKKT